MRKTFDEQSGFFDRQGQRLRDLDPVSPEKDQAIDASNSSIARLAARIGATNRSAMSNRYLRMVFAVIFIVVFGLGTTAYRHYMFDKEQDSANSGLDTGAAAAPNYQSMFSDSGSNGASTGNLPLPRAVASAAQQSQQQARQAIQSDSSKANDAGIIILALIYVFTQVIGILTGFKYSFFNGDAEDAYRGTHGKMSYGDYRSDVLEPVAQRAENRMEQLRSELAKKNPRFRDNVRRFSFIEAITQQVAAQTVTVSAASAIQVAATPVQPVAVVPSPQADAAPPIIPSATSQSAADASTPELDYHALAQSILSHDGEGRRTALAQVVATYGINLTGQGKLKQAIAEIKARRNQPAIDADLLSALDD
ncbi:MAG: hypothetical protein ACOY4Y_10125 [Pseudomonadota bacterium]